MKIVKNHACEFVMVHYISEFRSPLLSAHGCWWHQFYCFTYYTVCSNLRTCLPEVVDLCVCAVGCCMVL